MLFRSGGRVLLRHNELQKYITAQLQASSKLVSIRPDTIEYYFNRGQSKKVPVCLQGKIDVESQYYISRMYFAPDSVTVIATPSILDTIYAAYTQPVNYENIADTLIFHTALKKIKGAKFIPATVTGAVYVDIYTDKVVEVPIVGVNFPASKKLRTFPAKAKITFQVGMSQFKQITPDDFVICVS